MREQGASGKIGGVVGQVLTQDGKRIFGVATAQVRQRHLKDTLPGLGHHLGRFLQRLEGRLELFLLQFNEGEGIQSGCRGSAVFALRQRRLLFAEGSFSPRQVLAGLGGGARRALLGPGCRRQQGHSQTGDADLESGGQGLG
ncbi:MAG: hypothetical protein ACRESV_10765, partial [Nevskiales bacterium]